MLRPATHTLPASLEQRGTAVPFTTPALATGRVRADLRHKLVLALRGFSGDGFYIVPWRSVPDVAPMSIHDKALHQEIGVSGAVSPTAVRNAALKVASTGLAGPAASAAAKRAVAEDDRKAIETHFMLIIALLSAAEINVAELVRQDPGAGAWREHARQLLDQAAARIGVQAGGFFERSVPLSRTLAPVGLSNAPSSSRVRALLKILNEFKESVDAWGSVEKSDLAGAARFASELAETTFGRANHVLGQFDSRTADPRWILRDWRLEVTVCNAITTRLTWLLDGWDQVTALWDAARDSKIEHQRAIMGQLIPLLPVVPTGEGSGRMTKPPATPWRAAMNENLDIAVKARFEAAKARAVAF